MHYDKQDLIELRDRLHNLDPKNPKHQDMYHFLRALYITDAEGYCPYAYDDATGQPIRPGKTPKGNVTVGVGFNMSRRKARKEWTDTFGDAVDFDAVYRGEKRLTNEQINCLLEFSLESREEDIQRNYKKIWAKLRLNERLVIEDAYFNGPKLVRSGTRFHGAMHAYARTGDAKHLRQAVHEMRNRSNPEKSKGLQKRREAQAVLLSSQECPLYTTPLEGRLPAESTPVAVVPGQTVLPRGVDTWPPSEDSTYYIWRTQCDGQVRPSHLELEGKIFSDDNKPSFGHPGEDNNCRCWAEPLPQNIHIIHQKALNAYILWKNLHERFFIKISISCSKN